MNEKTLGREEPPEPVDVDEAEPASSAHVIGRASAVGL